MSVHDSERAPASEPSVVKAEQVVLTGGAFSAAILRASMEATGYTCASLARKMGLSESRIAAWTSGNVPINLATIERMPCDLAMDILARTMRVINSRNERRRMPTLPPMTHLGVVAAQLGEVASVTVAAEADLKWDPHEKVEAAKAWRGVAARANKAADDVEVMP